MESIIVIVGLLVSCAGVYLAWHSKGAGTWATFGFGFLLVLVGGPVSSRLGTLSLTGAGVEVAFNAQALSKVEEKSLREEAQQAFLSLGQQKGLTSTDTRVLLGSASKTFQSDLLSYISSIGFSPIQPIGAEILKPGTVVRFEQGRPIIWATSNEAFPELQITYSSIAIPRLDQRAEIPGKKTDLSFECEGGSEVQSTSLFALSTSISKNISGLLASDENLRVVQSIIVCTGFEIAARIKGDDTVEEDALRYPKESRLVLGVKLSVLQPRKPGE